MVLILPKAAVTLWTEGGLLTFSCGSTSGAAQTHRSVFTHVHTLRAISKPRSPSRALGAMPWIPRGGDLVRPWRKGQAGVWSTHPEGIRRSVEASGPLGTEAGMAERQVLGNRVVGATQEAQKAWPSPPAWSCPAGFKGNR